MSLDGFIAGPNDEVDWSFKFGSDKMADEVIREIGAVELDNRGFKESQMTENTILYGGMVKTPQFVLAHEPHEPVTIGGLTFTFINGIER